MKAERSLVRRSTSAILVIIITADLKTMRKKYNFSPVISGKICRLRKIHCLDGLVTK